MSFISSFLARTGPTLQSYGVDYTSQTFWSVVAGVTGLYLFYQWMKPRYDNSSVPINDKLLHGLKFVGVKYPSQIQLNDIESVVSEMKRVYKSNYTKPLNNRRNALKQLKTILTQHETELVEALNKDLGRDNLLAYAYDIFPTLAEVNKALKNLDKWNAPKRLGMSLLTFPSADYTIREPLGTVMINGIWNFPIQLLLSPLVGAIVAGNNAIVKPCNASPATAKLLGELIHKYMDPYFVQVVGTPDAIPDDRQCTGKLLENKFDLIFFTGSTRGGKYIMSQAAKTLTPVILEMGGKNAAIIDSSANLKLAAKQLIMARVVNCGQQCISPDYILCVDSIYDKFQETIIETAKSMFPTDFRKDSNQSRIVSDIQMERVIGLLKGHKGKVICGGKYDIKLRKFEPTIVEVGLDDPTIRTETFGPILWLSKIDSIEEGCNFINDGNKPLSLYLFSNNKKVRNYVMNNTSSGALQINGVVTYAGHSKIPFGGVGHSGMGRYHGKHSFESFSHEKPVIRSLIENPLLYPPWNAKWKIGLFRKVF